MKVERTGCFGARVVLQGDTLDEARAHALELAVRDGLVFVHPYDDEAVVAGQGTAALEMGVIVLFVQIGALSPETQ